MQSVWRSICILGLLLLILGGSGKQEDDFSIQEQAPVEESGKFLGQGFLPSAVKLQDPLPAAGGNHNSDHLHTLPWSCEPQPDKQVVLQVATRLFLDFKPHLMFMQMHPHSFTGDREGPFRA